MAFEAIRYCDRNGTGPFALVELDATQLDALAESCASATVLLLRTGDLRRFLDGGNARRLFGPLRIQHKTKSLAPYFRGGRVALEGKYTGMGWLRGNLEKLLAGGGPPAGVYLLGVSGELFDELAREAGVATSSPEDAFRGSSREAEEVRREIRRAATESEFADLPALILGPSGAGKEIVARAIHDLGRGARGGGWFARNCAEIPADLLEAELFGIEERTATAVAGRMGYWEAASRSNGTLFLNEVGELRLDLQAKLLRALEENEITRVGGRKPIPVRARVLADTNRDLWAMVQSGAFRMDLYFRLASIIIRLPPLAERGEDLDELAQHFWRQQVDSPKATLSAEIIEALRLHGLPGGVRELKALFVTLSSTSGELTPSLHHLLAAWGKRGDGPSFRMEDLPPPLRLPTPAEPGSFESLREQVLLFGSQRGRYQRLTGVLREILEQIVEPVVPLAFVNARTKSLSRVAERIERDRLRVEDLRDLCGARIVVQTEDQVRDVCALLERHFEIDGSRSMASGGASRSGYAARRLAVRLDAERAQALAASVDVDVPDDLLGLWAEVEIRTVLQNAWAQVSRDIAHAERLPVPARWNDELCGAARVLEAVDQAVARIHRGFAAYRTSYPAELSAEQRRRETAILTNVLASAPDPAVAVRLAKLAIIDADWDRAIAILEPHATTGYPPALRDLGVAICQKHRDQPESDEHQRGQKLLERACAAPHPDPDAWCSLGSTWKRRNQHDKARDCYARAHALDAADPYALWGLIEAELALDSGADTLAVLQPAIRRAIERCREHIEVGVNLPWALYDLGKFLLLLGEQNEALIASARAVEHSSADFQIRTSLQSLDKLATQGNAQPGVGEARAILALGRVAKFESAEARKQLDELLPATAERIAEPVVFVVDDITDDTPQVAARRAAVREALNGFRGTPIANEWLHAWANAVRSDMEVLVLGIGSSDATELQRCIGAAVGARVVEVVPADASMIRRLL